jgi:hypothetical protein
MEGCTHKSAWCRQWACRSECCCRLQQRSHSLSGVQRVQSNVVNRLATLWWKDSNALITHEMTVQVSHPHNDTAEPPPCRTSQRPGICSLVRQHATTVCVRACARARVCQQATGSGPDCFGAGPEPGLRPEQRCVTPEQSVCLLPFGAKCPNKSACWELIHAWPLGRPHGQGKSLCAPADVPVGKGCALRLGAHLPPAECPRWMGGSTSPLGGCSRETDGSTAKPCGGGMAPAC